MGVFKNGTITYDSDKMSQAVLSAKKIDDNANSINSAISSINSSIPSSFNSSLLTTTLSSIEKLNDKLENISTVFIEMQTNLESTMNDEVMMELLNSKYTELITLESGQSGFLYTPPGYSSTAGLPLVVCLGGAGHCTKSNIATDWGLAKLIGEGYNVDSVVWVPLSTNQKWTLDISKLDESNKYYKKILDLTGSKDKVANTMVSCEELSDKLKIDRNRISIMGSSSGAYAAFKYTHDLPNYFSTVVTYGCGGMNYEGGETIEQMQKQADSGTTYIIFNGTADENTHQRAADDLYNYLNSNNGQVMMYKINGGTHHHMYAEYLINTALINDILHIQKGQKLNTSVNEVKYISYDELLGSSITKNGTHELENNWYIPLTSANDSEDYTPLISSTEGITNANTLNQGSTTYTTDLSVYHNKPGFEVTKGNLTYEYLTEDQVREITAVVCAEMAGNYLWTYDDGLAIASTILNRCENENWIRSHGTNPIDQIRAPGQYAVYGRNSFWRYYNGQTDNGANLTQAERDKLAVAVKAAQDAIYGGIRNHLNYTEFRAPTVTEWQGYQVSDYGNVYNRSTYDNRAIGGNPVAVDLNGNVTLEVNSATPSQATATSLSSNSGTAQATTLNANVSSVSTPSNNTQPVNNSYHYSQESNAQAYTSTPISRPTIAINTESTSQMNSEASSVSSVGETSNVQNTILPENEFSDLIPNIQIGKLKSMEISKSHVIYDINDMTKEGYDSFIKDLVDNGYVLTENNKYAKKDVIIEPILEGDKLRISLNK